MRALRVMVEVTAVLVVGGLVVAGVRADSRERSGPPVTTGHAATKGKATAATSAKDGKARTTKADTSKAPSTSTTATRKTTTSTRKATFTSTAKQPTRTGYWYRQGPNKSRRVALSFDDCPRSLREFRTVIAGAERLDIGLMLFPTGACVRSGHFSAAYARAHGHYVFNHSISHPDLARLSYAGVLRQLGSPGIQSRYGRPPFGSYNATVARAYAAKGMRIWTWTVDTLDWRGRSRSSVISTAVHGPRAGGTVLMHMEWHGFSVSALRQMKSGLDKRGLGTCRNFPRTTPAWSWTVRC